MKRTTIFLFFIFTSFVYGQNDALQLHQKLRGWVTLGAGFSFPHGMNIDAGATCVLNNKHAFQLDYFAFSFYPTENSLNDLQSSILAYGIKRNFGPSAAYIISIGLSNGHGTLYGKDTSKKYTGLFSALINQPPNYIMTSYKYTGMYLSGQFLVGEKFCGFGIKAYYNIHRYSDYGLIFCCKFG